MGGSTSLRGSVVAALMEHQIDWGYDDDDGIECFCSCGARSIEIREHQADVVLAALGLEEIGYTFVPDGVAVHHDAPRLADGQPVYRLTGAGIDS